MNRKKELDFLRTRRGLARVRSLDKSPAENHLWPSAPVEFSTEISPRPQNVAEGRVVSFGVRRESTSRLLRQANFRFREDCATLNDAAYLFEK